MLMGKNVNSVVSKDSPIDKNKETQQENVKLTLQHLLRITE